MIDRFLDEIFISNAIGAALGHNKIYEPSCPDDDKPIFRKVLAEQLRIEAKRYTVNMSDVQHYEVIREISNTVSRVCGKSLINGRFRYGTAQKAFNLYLKFLWKLGKAATPPHCPVDSVVLGEARIAGTWTKCDCENEYSRWINELKTKASPLDLAEWEDHIWLKNAKGAEQ